MKKKYNVVDARDAAVPHFAVVWDEGGYEPGSTLFVVEIGEHLHAVELGLARLVDAANLQEQPLLDDLADESVTVFDLPAITEAVEASRKPFVLAASFSFSLLDRVVEHMFPGWKANGEVDSAALLAIDAITRSVLQLKSVPDSSSIGFDETVTLVEGVIERLQQFKSLCRVKPTVFPFADYQKYLTDRRISIADAEFESYDFRMELVDQDSGWRRDGDNRLMKVARFIDDDIEVRAVLHVVFAPNSLSVEETFALDLQTGSMI